MKIVTLLGSPRSNKNSATIANRFTETAAQLGAETRSYELNRLAYRGCQGCYACKNTLDHCVLQDDLTEVLTDVQDADLVVLASPVYYGDVTAQMKGFIDRSYSYLKPDYLTNPQPSRLTPRSSSSCSPRAPGRGALCRHLPPLRRLPQMDGVTESRLIRACGIGPASVDTVPSRSCGRPRRRHGRS